MLEFRRTTDDSELEKIYQLRYQVYCLEKGFLPAQDYPDGIETDVFDPHSVHFIVEIDDRSQKILGTMRLIFDSDHGFPVEKHFQLERPINDRSKTVELSRVMVAKDARKLTFHILMGFSKEVYLISREKDIEECYAVLEEPLLRLLVRMGLPFHKAGKENWYLGAETFPAVLLVKEALEALPVNNALLYTYLQEPSGAPLIF
jgi:N-acyl-L-homoserine lactone synthetase